MDQQVIINFTRPGKGVMRYIEGLVDADPVRIKTLTHVNREKSLKWCEEYWWQNGFIHQGILIGTVVKYLFFRKWFSVMQLLDREGAHLGYYVDIDTPIHKVRGEFYLTDMFLDLWVSPDGTLIELDRDEFEQGFRSGLITRYQYRKANLVVEMLKGNIANGEFFRMIQ